MDRRNRLSACALALWLAGHAMPAHAQEASTGQESEEALRTAAARGLFEEGMDAVDRRDFETAADRLTRSLELRESVVVRTNLGLVLIEVGRFVEASEHFRRVLRNAQASAEAHDAAAARLAEIEPRIGRLQIVIGGARDDVRAELDGRPLDEAMIGVPQPADPGAHRVVLHRGSREIASAEASVESGQLATLRVEAPPPSAEEVAEMEAARTRVIERERIIVRETGGGVEEQWWFWTILGVLVAGGVVGAIVGVVLSQPAEYQMGSSGAVFNTLVELP